MIALVIIFIMYKLYVLCGFCDLNLLEADKVLVSYAVYIVLCIVMYYHVIIFMSHNYCMSKFYTFQVQTFLQEGECYQVIMYCIRVRLLSSIMMVVHLSGNHNVSWSLTLVSP